MKRYTVAVDATLSWDIDAGSEEEALTEARRMLNAGVMTDYDSFRASLVAPWVEPAHTDMGYPSLEIVETWETET